MNKNMKNIAFLAVGYLLASPVSNAALSFMPSSAVKATADAAVLLILLLTLCQALIFLLGHFFANDANLEFVQELKKDAKGILALLAIDSMLGIGFSITGAAVMFVWIFAALLGASATWITLIVCKIRRKQNIGR